MPASGPLVGDYKKIKVISEFGVGAVVTKTISSKAAKVVRPCIYAEGNFVMNAELWSEYNLEVWLKDFLPKIKSEIYKPLLISVGYTKEDMNYLIPKLNPYADGFEISTHYVGKDLNTIKEILLTIRKYTSKPVYMKISPHIPDSVAFAKMVIENGGNGVVAINSLGPTMKIDITSRKVLLGNKDGEVWTSGPVIKPIALALINKIKREVPNCSIIGVGGIVSAEDVIEFLLAGADAVQLLSAAMIKGKDLYEKIIKDLPKTLEKYGFDSVETVISTKLNTGEAKYTPDYPKINYDKCTFCKLCERVCPYFAISSKDKIEVDEEKCFGCGLCQCKCPRGAIEGLF
jgi:dihydroorotate dehydrogenase (fumarate)